MDKFPNIKRIIFITDTHLGVRNNSNDWIEIHEDYFKNWFIPFCKKIYKPGDCLVHLGDVYDSRQSLNLRVLNLGIEIFESLSDIFKDGILSLPTFLEFKNLLSGFNIIDKFLILDY